jgi:uncharacterized membrane protein
MAVDYVCAFVHKNALKWLKDNMRKSEIVTIILLLLSLAIAIYFYPKLPLRIPSHWNAAGEVDDYASKFVGLFIASILLFFCLVLYIILPRIDPLKANIEKFRKYFDGFIILLFLFIIFLQVFIILWSLGTKLKPFIVFPVGLGIMFFYVGILVEKAKRNWFIGIRTPWTMTDDRVWDRTHKVGGIMFKVMGVISVIGAFFGKYAFFFVIIPVIILPVLLILFSYVDFKNLPK